MVHAPREVHSEFINRMPRGSNPTPQKYYKGFTGYL